MASGRQPQRGFPPMKTQRRKETLLADSREWRQADISTECLGQQLLIRGRWHVMGAVPPRRCHCGGEAGRAPRSALAHPPTAPEATAPNSGAQG